jgi:prophage maintenance system killer protein
MTIYQATPEGRIALTAEEETAFIAKRDAAIAALPTRQAEANRNKRNALLAETDYLALSDNTMSAEMTTYRQALRDITNHANWPNLEDADWPTKP